MNHIFCQLGLRLLDFFLLVGNSIVTKGADVCLQITTKMWVPQGDFSPSSQMMMTFFWSEIFWPH